MIGICRFHDDGGNAEYWLQPCILQDTSFNSEKCMRVGNVNFAKAMTQGPRMMDRLAAIHHYDQGTFATDKVDEELEECVDSKCLLPSVSHSIVKDQSNSQEQTS